MKPRPKFPDGFYEKNENQYENQHEKFPLYDEMRSARADDLKRNIVYPSYMHTSGVHFSPSVA